MKIKKMELEQIKNNIHEVQGKKVILDFELAAMYQVETKYLKRIVRNNMKRFPLDFMIELTKEEWDFLRCKISTSKNQGGIRYLPFAFTEQGVAMLSGLLNSDKAIETNIAIMRAFVMMRQWALTYEELSQQLKELESRHEQKFDDINQVLEYLLNEEKPQISRKKLGYK
jgi:hypothetical protein